jgi:hypothetical protein
MVLFLFHLFWVITSFDLPLNCPSILFVIIVDFLQENNGDSYAFALYFFKTTYASVYSARGWEIPI